MKQISVIALCFLGISLLVSCIPPAQSGYTEQSTIKVYPSIETPSTAIIRLESTLTPTSLVSVAGVTQTTHPTPTQSPPVALPVQICSPLAFQSVDELHEIVADPYDPPPPGREERHHGVDFSYYRRKDRLSILGEGIRSVFPGRMAAVVLDKYPYGNMVIVETTKGELPNWLADELQIMAGESLYLLYAHMDKSPLPQLDEMVEACQPLGEVGKSGDFNVEHLHLEARIGPGGTTFNGMAYYHTNTTVEERENYILWRTSGDFRHFDPMILFSSALDENETIVEN
jgi:murein DD-endopeptidase MepM/ murein hydrolase activator NlpD